MISRNAFRDVTALALVRALGLHPAPRSRANSARVRCLWHSDTDPSLSLQSKDHGVAILCRVCQAKGDHFTLAAAVWSLHPVHDFPEVATRLADALGLGDVTIPAPTGRRHKPPPDPLFLTAQAIEQAADDWLSGRSPRDADLATIEAAGPALALDALDALSRVQHEPLLTAEQEREAEFERLADHFARGGWTHVAVVPGVATDWEGIGCEMADVHAKQQLGTIRGARAR